MRDSLFDSSRREFLRDATAAAGVALVAAVSPLAIADEPPKKATKPLRVAAIGSIFRFKSHAYHIVGRFVHGYEKEGQHHQPPFEVARMYNHQSPENDLAPSFCKTHNIELCQSASATLGPDGTVDVDAVLLIIEHGDYPLNEYQQILYPRFEFFMEIVRRFRAAGRVVPIFVDKHLSYDHQQAAKMIAAGRELKIPLMAGSSLPVTWRIPSIEPPLGTRYEELVATFGYDRGTVEIYLFHALEVLQVFAERRAGGETGVRSVEAISGDAVWKAADEGRFSWKLVEAAIARCPSRNVGPIRENVLNPLAVLVEYKDGTRAAVLNLIEASSDFGFAARVAGETQPLSTCCFLPSPPGARFFDPLTWNIEQFFQNRAAPYPVERTWLTSTLCDLAVHSLKDGNVVASPALNIQYTPPRDSGYFRGTP